MAEKEKSPDAASADRTCEGVSMLLSKEAKATIIANNQKIVLPKHIFDNFDQEKIGEGIVVIASNVDGKVNLMATATDAAMKAGAHAGNLIKEIAKLVGGGGGGRPNMAQAGGKNPAGIDDAIAKAKGVAAAQLA